MATINQIGTDTGAVNTLLQGAGAGTAPTFQSSPEVSGTFTAGTGLVATTGNIDATAGNITAGGYIEVAGSITSTNGYFYGIRSSNDTTPAYMVLQKNRAGATIQNGDNIGSLLYQGWDGGSYITGASIISYTTGAIAAGQVPSALRFATNDGTSLNATMTITSAGLVDVVNDVQARTLFADGDEGTGKASTNALTNVVNATLSTGTMTINGTTTNPGSNTGFIKMYVGTTAVWVPYFDNIAP